MRSELFSQVNQENQTQERWSRHGTRMLRTVVTGADVISAKGAMVAYQGNITFQHEGAGSVEKMLKKLVTSDGMGMMRVSGQGEVFFAREAANVFTIQLEGDGLTIGANNLLAFDASLNWDIKRVQGAGIMAAGFFNLQLEGHGMAAVTCHGDPLILDCSQQPTFVDPNAAVCWSSNLVPGIVSSMNMRSMLRGGTGEAFQMKFWGPGFVIVQPSEGYPVPTA